MKRYTHDFALDLVIHENLPDESRVRIFANFFHVSAVVKNHDSTVEVVIRPAVQLCGFAAKFDVRLEADNL